MGNVSSIQWTDASWNVARGCTKVDEDCKFCYMYRDSMSNTRYNPLEVVRTKTVFDMPLKLKEPSKIFTCSLTDFFHEAIDGYRHEAWDIIRRCPQHTFQILTKRPERIALNLPKDWGEGYANVWLGTSCGTHTSTDRISELLSIKASKLFVSLEPLYGEIDLKRIKEYSNGTCFTQNALNGKVYEWDAMGKNGIYDHGFMEGRKLDWVIVGGESGNENGKYRYRECKLQWIEKIVTDCKANGTAVFVKQMGTHLSKQLLMTDRHGGNIDEFPEHLRIREFPKP